MCLVPDVVFPPKFKTPEFEKYDGTSCPKSHLHMYARKMTAHHGNDKLLIHCFQDSLTGAAMGWYIRLEKAQIKTFVDLSNAFMKQYKYNEDAAPDRAQLQSMAKKLEESFKEYTQRWRALASQVIPRLEEEEQLSIFVDTLKEPYYDYLVGSVASSFNALIKVGEKIEGRIRSGKLVVDQPKSGICKKPNFMKKKEGEALAVFTEPKGYKAQNPKYQASHIATPSTQPNYTAHNNNRQNYNQTQSYQPRQNQNQTQAYQNQTQNRNPERRGPQFDPIPIPYAELYSHLLRERMISPIIGTVPESPGAWFNPNVTCEYHSGVIGHSIEHCRALKHKVQSLINANQLHFKPIVPDIDRNPLPNHGNQGVNVVEKTHGSTFVWEADEVKTPMRVIFEEMCKHGMVERMVEDEDSASCELHGKVGHTLDECPEFKLLLQKMLDMRLITIERGPSYQTVNATTRCEEDMRRTMRPSITRYEPVLNIPDNAQLHPQITRWVPVISRMEPVLRPAVEEKSQPFPYETDKAVPWIYSGGNSETTGKQIEVTNVVGDNRITRSGRVYVPSDAEKALAKDKGKGKVCIPTEDELESNLNDLLHKHGDKGEVSNEEACELLKFIKQSEYRAVDQLNRTPARISILSLLMKKRLADICHGQLYQKRLMRAYAKKVRPRHFQEGDLVLKKILPIQKDHRGKLTPNYEGPFVVKKAFSRGALILTTMDGNDLPLSVNSDAVKKYYA
ncbi:PREDICTED: uncharacterized protein LOC109341140 [Lupinus angustifolius]|uniref:uncharacterized protein LOC109341140 n=1 Tax=Lupinus angustifolius TaxID=3871 RepID=UPI00092E9CF4|nr:PREDICTED: uncharacterized protein LOC109341140 [Lupinus angustifolius]